MEFSNSPAVYAIPASYRRLENQHIVFWLIKDLSWCLVWKPLGVLMIIPTVSIAAVILWRTRGLPTERAHNLAVLFWIIANSYWMVSEFAGFEAHPVLGGLLAGKQLALVPFGAGLLVLLHHGRARLWGRDANAAGD